MYASRKQQRTVAKHVTSNQREKFILIKFSRPASQMSVTHFSNVTCITHPLFNLASLNWARQLHRSLPHKSMLAAIISGNTLVFIGF